MGNKNRDKKRQKVKNGEVVTSNNPTSADLLGDDSLKGHHELELEALLFEKPSKYSNPNVKDSSNDMQHIIDSDLFFVDDSTLHTGSNDAEQIPIASSSTLSNARLSRPSAWHDPADASLQVDIKSVKQRRKLRTKVGEDEISGVAYESKLRDYFTGTLPTPQWAIAARSNLHGQRKKKRRRLSSLSNSDLSEDDTSHLLRLGSTGDALLESSGLKQLKPGHLSIERLRDVNHASRSEGSIHSLQFHPNPKVPVLFTAAGDRRIRFFNVDGHTNPHLQTVHIPSLPITGADFHPSGASILCTGPRPYYYQFDLQSGAVTRSAVKSVSVNNGDLSMEVRRFSPSGNLLAVAGKHGYIHLLDWTASGGEQVVASLKGNGPVTSLAWAANGKHLYSLSRTSEVLVWDIAQRRCINQWIDEGGYGSQHMCTDIHGSYLSVGSSSGFVNLYDLNGTTQNAEARPKFLKSLANLTTPTTSITFNASSEMVSIASSSKKNQYRLIHLPTLTAFSNWPTAGTPLGSVNVAAFSPTDRYVAIGNTQGQALLYSLRHYNGG